MEGLISSGNKRFSTVCYSIQFNYNCYFAFCVSVKASKNFINNLKYKCIKFVLPMVIFRPPVRIEL